MPRSGCSPGSAPAPHARHWTCETSSTLPQTSPQLITDSLQSIMEASDKNLLQFKKVIKSLQSSSLNIPEIRQLKQEQEYLQKLNKQRNKIETLKAKFDEKDHIIRQLKDDNTKLKKELQQYLKRCQSLEEVILHERTNSQRLSMQISSFQHQRERYRSRCQELELNIEDHKKSAKTKDLAIMNLEDDYKRKFRELKDAYSVEKNKLIQSYEQRMEELDNAEVYREELQIHQELVERQNKSMKLQEQHLVDLERKNKELESELEEMRQIHQKGILINDVLVKELEQYKEENERLNQWYKQQEKNEEERKEVEELKKRIQEMRNGEIELIDQQLLNF